ncbi:hypothetical protein A2U01_0060815, partial [Trifolium medium]|nr:hypothetical protein [Trifolium medium]
IDPEGPPEVNIHGSQSNQVVRWSREDQSVNLECSNRSSFEDDSNSVGEMQDCNSEPEVDLEPEAGCQHRFRKWWLFCDFKKKFGWYHFKDEDELSKDEKALL